MDEKLKVTLINILTHFRDGLEDVKAGTENNEDQPMLNELNYALPLVKNLISGGVSGSLVDNIRGRRASHMVFLKTAAYQSEKSINLKARINECTHIIGMINDR